MNLVQPKPGARAVGEGDGVGVDDVRVLPPPAEAVAVVQCDGKLMPRAAVPSMSSSIRSSCRSSHTPTGSSTSGAALLLLPLKAGRVCRDDDVKELEAGGCHGFEHLITVRLRKCVQGEGIGAAKVRPPAGGTGGERVGDSRGGGERQEGVTVC